MLVYVPFEHVKAAPLGGIVYIIADRAGYFVGHACEKIKLLKGEFDFIDNGLDKEFVFCMKNHVKFVPAVPCHKAVHV